MAFNVIENRYGLLALEEPDLPPPTLGEVCRLEQSESLAGLMLWVFDQLQHSTTVKQMNNMCKFVIKTLIIKLISLCYDYLNLNKEERRYAD